MGELKLLPDDGLTSDTVRDDWMKPNWAIQQYITVAVNGMKRRRSIYVGCVADPSPVNRPRRQFPPTKDGKVMRWKHVSLLRNNFG